MDLAETGVLATVIAFLWEYFFARLAMRLGTVGKGILDGILTLCRWFCRLRWLDFFC